MTILPFPTVREPDELSPIDPDPADEGFLLGLWEGITASLRRANAIDDRQQGAADLNAVWHDADADRKLRQPGTVENMTKKPGGPL